MFPFGFCMYIFWFHVLYLTVQITQFLLMKTKSSIQVLFTITVQPQITYHCTR